MVSSRRNVGRVEKRKPRTRSSDDVIKTYTQKIIVTIQIFFHKSAKI